MIVQRVRSVHFYQMTAAVAVLSLLVICAPLFARSRKGDKLRNQARQEELRGNYDKALELAQQAVEVDASDPAYQLEVRRVRFEDGMMHVGTGHRLRDGGHLEEALAEFEKAVSIDPSSDIAAQEVTRTRAMIERYKNPGATPDGAAAAAARKEQEKSLTPVQLSRKRSVERTDALLPIPGLRPLNNELIDLKMNNQRPRVLFETVSKLAGVNVLFDPEYEQQQTIRALTIDLSRTTLDQALDQLSVISKSFWKPLSANTIFVTVDNPQKRREYAEQVVKVFYLSNLTTPQEMQEILTVLRTVVDVQKVFSYTAQNALIVRAEADTMALVEKLISDLDKPRAEVAIDVMVMEVSSTYIRNLSAAFAGTGINTSATFIPRPGITTPGIQSSTGTGSTSTTGTSTTTTGTTTGTTGTTTASGTSSITSVPLSALGRISSADYSVTTLPGATFEAVLNDSSTRVLQSPQIRAVSNAKAELKIGTKVPTASGSFQPGVAGVGVSPLVNTQFTYLDVGVNMTMTPQVMDNDEVSMHLDLDISQVNNYQNLGGISEPVIGQNKLSTDIRVREGQVNLIGGIIQQTDSKATTGIPGLAGIPLLGRLFSSENLEKDRTELVVALIPHIVRGQSIDETNLKGVAAGNATQIKVSYAPQDGGPAAATTSTATAPSAPPAAPPAAAPPVTAPPATAPPATAPPATAPPAGPGPQAAVPGGPARLSFRPGTINTQLSSAVTVTVFGDNVTNMASAAAQLRFDPSILRINNILAGDLSQRNAPTVTPSKNILNDSGVADMSIARGPSDGPVSGSGVLFTVVFQAVGRGNTNVTVTSSSMTGANGQPLPVAPPPPLVVNVN